MKINKKFLFLVCGIVILGLLLIYFLTKTPASNNFENTNVATKIEFSTLLQNALNKRIEILSLILKDPAIVEAIKRSNEKNKKITPVEIASLDEIFKKSKESDDFILRYTSSDAAKRIKEFQENNFGFSEIFVTDEMGLNVAQTNKTTDLYQADEDWWTVAYDNGNGKAYYGQIEFDESAQAEGISIYVPIKDPNTNEVIGIAKSLVSIVALKLEL